MSDLIPITQEAWDRIQDHLIPKPGIPPSADVEPLWFGLRVADGVIVSDHETYWRMLAYARLGAVRDSMPPEHVAVVQDFLGPLSTVKEGESK